MQTPPWKKGRAIIPHEKVRLFLGHWLFCKQDRQSYFKFCMLAPVLSIYPMQSRILGLSGTNRRLCGTLISRCLRTLGSVHRRNATQEAFVFNIISYTGVVSCFMWKLKMGFSFMFREIGQLYTKKNKFKTDMVSKKSPLFQSPVHLAKTVSCLASPILRFSFTFSSLFTFSKASDYLWSYLDQQALFNDGDTVTLSSPRCGSPFLHHDLRLPFAPLLLFSH